jgi:hypothetical protein
MCKYKKIIFNFKNTYHLIACEIYGLTILENCPLSFCKRDLFFPKKAQSFSDCATKKIIYNINQIINIASP